MKDKLCRVLLWLLFCGCAQAQGSQGVGEREIEVGDALVCNTQKQVERYVALYKGDRDEAILAVNAEGGDPTACGVISAAFVRGPHVATARQANMAFDIVRILVVGVAGVAGFRVVEPVPYFAIFGVVEYDV